MNPASHGRTKAEGLAAFLVDHLEAARRGYLGVSTASDQQRYRATIDRLFMFVYAAGHERNLYTPTGIPRTHNAWEMQYLLDKGLLFGLYERCGEAVQSCSDRVQLEAAVAQLLAELDTSDPQRLLRRARAHYATNIAAFLTQRRALRVSRSEIATIYFECVVILAYLRLAVLAQDAIITFDLFPAHTGSDNVVEGLKGLVSLSVTGASHRRARRFYCCKAESYTRYYGMNLARELGAQTGANELRFSLVVPHANGVRHIALTRCWPIDGAEHAARHLAEVHTAWAEVHTAWAEVHTASAEVRVKPPTILVSGYSQGGAVVRLLDDALRRKDVLARGYFKDAAPRAYLRRCRTLARIIAGEWDCGAIPIYTVSIATMGGIDGVGFAERYPQLHEFAQDQRGAAGVRAHANSYGGLHLGICHDFDPARWVVPGPLFELRKRWRRGDRKLNLVRILLKFGGPNLVFHGGAWTSDTKRAFADNPAAKALIDDVFESLVSEGFVDQAHYVDSRCTRAAFPHLAVGTHGYPGWVVVAKFGLALRELAAARANPNATVTELIRESSWHCDILPAQHDYEYVVAASRRFHDTQRRRAEAVLARLDQELVEVVRERFEQQGSRMHLLRDSRADS